MWTFIATSVIVISALIAVRSAWRFANMLVGFDGFGGEFNPWLAVCGWTWVALFYISYTSLF